MKRSYLPCQQWIKAAVSGFVLYLDVVGLIPFLFEKTNKLI
jgi:hypothetical protein